MSDANQAESPKERFEYIRATIVEGVLTLRYRIEGSIVEGSDQHDEDVSAWSDYDIRTIAAMTIDAIDQKDEIEVIWN